jgi:hypothetical protein
MERISSVLPNKMKQVLRLSDKPLRALHLSDTKARDE